MSTEEILDVIDENNTVIDTATRTDVHKKGLLHREVYVWIVTPDNKLIFQNRSANKDTFPGLLETSMGGHVSIGMNYEESAVRELKEETGITALPSDLMLVKLFHANVFDEATGMKNNSLKGTYLLLKRFTVEELSVEQGEATHFEAWSFDDLYNLTKSQKKRFIPLLYSQEYLEIYKKIQEVVRRRL